MGQSRERERRCKGTGENEGSNTEGEEQTSRRNSSVSERVDADDTIVAFTPRIPPHVQPLTNASGQSSAGRTASRVLSSGMLFFTNDGVS